MKKHLFILACSLLFLGSTLFSQTVYVTNTGEKYHSSGCRYLSKSKIAIELKDALGQGYEACKVCRPTQTVKQAVKKETKQSESPTGNTTQCTAITKTGSRCKNTTKSSNGKCSAHGGN